MKSRTCPHCNYQYSVAEYRKLLLKFVFSEWNCKNCNKKLTFDMKRRVIVALAFGCLYVAIFSIKDAIGMTPMRWTALLSIYIIGSLYIFTFDTFKKAE
jgi:CXXC-20-CXXC protein